MKRLDFSLVGLLIIAGLMIGGCDAVVNPLVFDGSPLSAVIEVDTETSSYAESQSINLGELLEAIDDVIDSISVYNITLRIERLSGTSENLTLSGAIQLNNLNLATLSNVPITEFQNTRSIFEAGVSQFLNVDGSVMAFLNSLLAQSPLPTVTVGVVGDASDTPVRLRFTITLYTQVYTTP